MTKKKFTIRGKLIATSLSIVFAVSVALIAVLAATNYNWTAKISSSAKFTAVDVDAKVYVKAIFYRDDEAQGPGVTAGSYEDLSGKIKIGSVTLTQDTEPGDNYGRYYFTLGNSSNLYADLTLPTTNDCDIYTGLNGTLPSLSYFHDNISSNIACYLPEEFGYRKVDSSYMYYEFEVVNTGSRDIYLAVDEDANDGVSNVSCIYSYNIGQGRTLSRSNGFEIISTTSMEANGGELPPADTGTCGGSGKFSMVAYLADSTLTDTTLNGINIPVTLRRIDYQYGKGNLTSIDVTLEEDITVEDFQVSLYTSTDFAKYATTKVIFNTYTLVNDASGNIVISEVNNTNNSNIAAIASSVVGSSNTYYVDIWMGTQSWPYDISSSIKAVGVEVSLKNSLSDYGLVTKLLANGSSRNGGWPEYGSDALDDVIANKNITTISEEFKKATYSRKYEVRNTGGFTNFSLKYNVEKIVGTNVTSSSDYDYTVLNKSVSLTPKSTTGASEVPAYYGDIVVSKILSTGSSGIHFTSSINSLPKGVVEIGDYAFYANKNDAYLNIPDSVIKIGSYAFANRNNMVNPLTIIIPKSVISVGSSAFYNNYSNNVNNQDAIIIESGVLMILASGFLDCKYVKSVKMPNSVKSATTPFTRCNFKAFTEKNNNNITFPGSWIAYSGDSNVATNLYAKSSTGLRNLVQVAPAYNGALDVKSTNIFTSNNATDGRYLNYLGVEVTSSSWSYSDYIPVINSVNYRYTYTTNTAGTAQAMCFYDKDFNLCSTKGYSFSSRTSINFTTPSTCAYIRLSFRQADIKNISLEISAFSIIYGAGQYSKITSLNFSEFTGSIGNAAFYKSEYLTGTISIPATIKTIGSIFTSNPTETSHTRGPFESCTALTGIDLTNATGLTTLGDFAFFGCKNLGGNLFIPGNITSLGRWTFSGVNIASDNTTACFSQNPGTVTFDRYLGISKIPDYLFKGCKLISQDSLVISSSITEIGTESFFYCQGIKGISFATNDSGAYTITTIGGGSFRNTGLESLTIPNSVTTIYSDAFFDCTSLTALDLTNASSLITIGDNAFYNCSSLSNELIIPSAVETIGASAFANCNQLFANATNKILTIPDSVTEVGNYAFENTFTVDGQNFEINIRGKIGSGTYIFKNCPSLYMVNITNNSIDTIGEGWFYNSGALQVFSVPDGKTYDIGDYAFYQSGIEDVRILDIAKDIGSYAFFQCPGMLAISFGTNVTSIGNFAFSGCSNLGTLNLENATNLETIGDHAFYNCSALMGTLSIPAKVSSIGSYAFSGDENKAPYDMSAHDSNAFVNAFVYFLSDENNVNLQIGDHAFYGCTFGAEETGSGFTLRIPKRISSIGARAFSSVLLHSDSSPAKLVFESRESPLSIGEYAFAYNIIQNKLELPVCTVNNYAFAGINIRLNTNDYSDISNIKNTNNTTGVFAGARIGKVIGEISGVIGDEWFKDSSITEFFYRSDDTNITSIGANAFQGCTRLTSFTVGGSVTSIGADAFKGCTNISGITFVNTLGWQDTSGNSFTISETPANNVSKFTSGSVAITRSSS